MLTSTTIGLGSSPALLVVDATIAFTSQDCPLGADFTKELAAINVLLELAKNQRWPRIFTTVVYPDKRVASVFRRKLPDLNLLTPESDWVKISAELEVEGSDRVIEKSHASAFFGTDLNDHLKNADCDSVVVAGFTTSGCVRASAVDALQHNYRTIVVEDAVGDRDDSAHAANLRDLALKYADVIRLQDLVGYAAAQSL
jgi:nicotinamidase-related amidase